MCEKSAVQPVMIRRLAAVLVLLTLGLFGATPVLCQWPGAIWLIISDSLAFGAMQGWAIAISVLLAIWIVLGSGFWLVRLLASICLWIASLMLCHAVYVMLLRIVWSAANSSLDDLLDHHRSVMWTLAGTYGLMFSGTLIALLLLRFWSGWRFFERVNPPWNPPRARMLVLVAIFCGVLVPITIMYALELAWLGYVGSAVILGVIATFFVGPVVWMFLASNPRPSARWAGVAVIVVCTAYVVDVSRGLTLAEILRLPAAGWFFAVVPLCLSLLIIRRAGYRLTAYTAQDLTPATTKDTVVAYPLDD